MPIRKVPLRTIRFSSPECQWGGRVAPSWALFKNMYNPGFSSLPKMAAWKNPSPSSCHFMSVGSTIRGLSSEVLWDWLLVWNARMRVLHSFDGAEWLFELKYDGFRALAYLEHGRCRLVSRNGHGFSSFESPLDHLGIFIRT